MFLLEWDNYSRNLSAVNSVATIYLFGAFQVIGRRGNNITPKGQKAKALIALVAASERAERTRSWLCDKLWSESGPEQAFASLRQTIREIRKSFGNDLNDLMEITRSTIRIRQNSAKIDCHEVLKLTPSDDVWPLDVYKGEFLEGIDVQDPEFEEWLSIERSRWTDIVETFNSFNNKHPEKREARTLSVYESANDSAIYVHDTSTKPVLKHIGIGILPTIDVGNSCELSLLGDRIIEDIVKSLDELEPIDIYDFRDKFKNNLGSPNTGGPDFLLRVRVNKINDNVSISILTYRTESQKLIWTHSINADQTDLLRIDGLSISGFINQNVDRISNLVHTSSKHDGDGNFGIKHAYTILCKLFQLKSDSVEVAESLINDAYADNPTSIYISLLTYVNSFKVGENLGAFDEETGELTREIIKKIEPHNPFNSMSLACIGHVKGYVYQDYSASEELLTNALAINPHQAFAWDHYALHKIYTGKYQTALENAQKAVRLGSFSPLRYTYETTLAMAATLAGEYKTAIHYANRALDRQPRFLAAMRYLTLAHGLSGHEREARSTLKRILETDPDFTNEEVYQRRFSLFEASAQAKIQSGLKAAGVG